MKSKKVFTAGIVSLIIFISIATYLWYSYFNNYGINKNENTSPFFESVELISSKGIDYTNATNNDDDSIIPIYYFQISNKADKPFEYVLYLESTTVNDGCTPETTLELDELEYELRFNDSVIQTGSLSSIRDNVLEINTISAKTINNYSLKIKLKNETVDYNDKHFHYIVSIRENK